MCFKYLNVILGSWKNTFWSDFLFSPAYLSFGFICFYLWSRDKGQRPMSGSRTRVNKSSIIYLKGHKVILWHILKIFSQYTCTMKSFSTCRFNTSTCIFKIGRMVFRSEEIYQDVCRDNLVAVKYVDDHGKPTEVYPFNPNGSRDGVAALCSDDGRHLAIMPHPERCFLPWQCPWMPQGMRRDFDVSPWFKMFQNAFDWCMEQSWV